MAPHETTSLLDWIDAGAMAIACLAVVYVGQLVFSTQQSHTSKPMAYAVRIVLVGAGLSYGVESVEPWIGDQKWANALGHLSVAGLWVWIALFHKERFEKL